MKKLTAILLTLIMILSSICCLNLISFAEESESAEEFRYIPAEGEIDTDGDYIIVKSGSSVALDNNLEDVNVTIEDGAILLSESVNANLVKKFTSMGNHPGNSDADGYPFYDGNTPVTEKTLYSIKAGDKYISLTSDGVSLSNDETGFAVNDCNNGEYDIIDYSAEYDESTGIYTRELKYDEGLSVDIENNAGESTIRVPVKYYSQVDEINEGDIVAMSNATNAKTGNKAVITVNGTEVVASKYKIYSSTTTYASDDVSDTSKISDNHFLELPDECLFTVHVKDKLNSKYSFENNGKYLSISAKKVSMTSGECEISRDSDYKLYNESENTGILISGTSSSGYTIGLSENEGGATSIYMFKPCTGYKDGTVYTYKNDTVNTIKLYKRVESEDYIKTGVNVTLKDSTDMNLSLSELADGKDIGDFRIEYSYRGKDFEITPESANDIITLASCAAKELCDSVNVKIYYKDACIKDKTISQKEYCETIINDNYDDNTKALCKALLNFGAAAQTYFGYNSDNPANSSCNDDENIDALTVAENYNEKGKSGDYTLEAASASLSLKSKTSVNFYFAIPDGDEVTYEVARDGNAITDYETATCTDGRTKITIAGINADKLDTVIKVKITCGDESVEYTYSPLSWAYSMQSNSDAKTAHIAKAIYNYYVAAKAVADAN